MTAVARIEGIRDFSRALKRAGEQYPTAMKAANKELAKEVVDKAKARSARVSRQAAKAARSLRATNTLNYAAIRLGGARYPYALGAEFGAKQYAQFMAFRGNQWGGWSGGPGYFLHPTIREEAPGLIDDYFKRLEEIHAQAFPK